jgi:hypothetical protein
MTADPQYWYARSGDNLFARHHYGVVHWKGFVALFATIMSCIGLLLIGGLTAVFVLTGEIAIESMVLKFGAVILGAALVGGSIWLAFYAFRTLRKRVDPVNNAAHYRKKFFRKLSGK